MDPSRIAILRAARRAFAVQPYDVVTLRGIAADANVSAALIVTHFGSKEALFEQVADFREAAELLIAAPDEELGRHAVETLVNYRRDNGLDLLDSALLPHVRRLLVRVIFAAGSGDERALIREHFRDQVTRAFAARLTGADAELRAELITAQLLGLGAAISANKTGPIATADPETIADLYAPALQQLIH